MTLPPSVQRLFHRYRADQLDTERHAAIIIPTVMDTGTLEDWLWLLRTYGWDTIRAWIANPDHAAQLAPPNEWFWTGLLLDKPHMTPRWSGGNRRRRILPDALPDWWPDAWRDSHTP
jgi:hypothetical protein